MAAHRHKPRSRNLLLFCLSALLLFTPPACAAPPTSDDQASWRRHDPLPMAVISPASSVSGARWIVTGGVRSDFSAAAEVQVFDLHTQTWSLGQPLRQGRLRHAQITLADGRVLVVGGQRFAAGQQRFEPLPSCELIEPDGDGVAPAPDLPAPIGAPTLTTLPDGRVLAVGGTIACIFDPATDAWADPIALREPRAAHAAVALPDRNEVVVIGGNRRRVELIEVDRQRSVALTAVLPFPIDDTAAALLPDGRVWVLGGQRADTGRSIDDTFLLDLGNPGPTRLTRGPRLPIGPGLADHRLVALHDGRLVLVGGESDTAAGDIERTTALLLDTVELTIAPLPDTAVPHDDATAVANGHTVYVAAGVAPSQALGGILPPMPVAAVESLDLPAD